MSSSRMDAPTKKRKSGRKSLRDKIKAEMVLEECSWLRFVPDITLKRLLSPEVVRAALEERRSQFKADIPELVEFVCNKATLLFAILAWMEAETVIEQFYEHSFGDEKLPVKIERKVHAGLEDEDDQVEVEAFAFNFGKPSVINSHPFIDEDHWTERTIDHLCNDDQWHFLSPIFHANQFRYTLHERSRMPFVDQYAVAGSRKETNFSVVEEWRIHREHLQMGELTGLQTHPDEHPRVAIKELKKTGLQDAEFQAIAEAEAGALEMIRELNHPHLIKAIAYYTIGKKHYVMFPWAVQGNLRDFWKKDPPRLNQQYLKWFFTQLCGIAEAIERLHHGDERFWRHGDLKPENILCFDGSITPGNGLEESCILIIADVGLAKGHEKMTEVRKEATRTISGTVMYEPPEAELQANQPRSRRYDIWSIGCIYLEFTIWLLYGTQELNRFQRDLSSLGGTTRFYVIDEVPESRRQTARLNAVVQKWVDWIRKDARCPEQTALRSLVEMVVTRLLVANVSTPPVLSRTFSLLHEEGSADLSSIQPSPSIVRTSTDSGYFEPSDDLSTQVRATAVEMDDCMKMIFDSAVDAKTDWLRWNLPAPQGPRQYGNSLDPSDIGVTIKHIIRETELNEYRFTPLNDDWDYTPDSEFAQEIFTDPSIRSNLSQSSHILSRLCFRCSNMQLWLPRCSFSDTPQLLKEKSKDCDMCRLLYNHIIDRKGENEDNGIVQFFRAGSSLISSYKGGGQPIASLYTLPMAATLGTQPISSEIQTGFPKLPEAGSPTHTKVLTGWIRDCNVSHQCLPKNDTFLPSRVLDVGAKGSASVRLCCNIQGHTVPGKYIALSHRWGSTTENGRFCTLLSNIKQFEKSIEYIQLPKTFQDAIKVTRSLGIQYLWIDSLCIVQDDDKDWDTESKFMEQIFSSAYVTIAASCASGTDDGFLKPRPKRQCVTFSRDNGEIFYLCDAIDNFDVDVEQGELNKRGWVLQERALSRRTIYFTEKQTYWECGEGVRCETLTKMTNRKASFLGDANFPRSVKSYVKGMKIELYQDLYQRYSNLALSYDDDRPIAIKGLERRLLDTLNTVGGYGVFDCYLHRSLLWQRSGDSLSRIHSVRMETAGVPSWSWMAYNGGIEYMDIPFGKVFWVENLISPFDYRGGGKIEGKPLRIKALAWDMIEPRSNDLILDEPNRILDQSLKCVIFGTSKQETTDESQVHYTLIISPSFEEGSNTYERLGVAFLKKKQIVLDSPGQIVHIK